MDNLISDLEDKMQKTILSLNNEFNKIRTGRANPSILDDIKIDYYGNPTPINQAASISVEEGRTLTISPWDKSLIGDIEKAIMKSDLGLNPNSSNDLIRITMPVLTEETRGDYIKQARSEAENAKIAIRNIRRDANNLAKDSEKNKAIFDIIKSLNLSSNKAEKDISIYKSSIKKMQQAKELIEESKLQNKKKRTK